MGPPVAAVLPDELMEEILLRIPPSDPATLARAAVAGKRWCRFVTSPGFRRRYCARHRAAPMLGFFCDPDGLCTFVPASSSFRPKPRADRRHLRPEDARHRHGRVLLRAHYPHGRILLRAPAGSCDHLDCHRGHFIVVLIGHDYQVGMLSCVYSSQDGKWSEIIFAPHLRTCFGVDRQCIAHVGNALYCMIRWGNKILRYDLRTREFSVMEPPVMLSHYESERILTTMEDGLLGLAVLCQSTLHILSTDEEFGWGGTKIIDLKKCGNSVPWTTRPSLLGFAGDIGLVFMKAENIGILSVDIKSAQVKVLDKRPCISWIVPYVNFCFCTPGK